jgi:hypothetical protein
LEEGRKEARKKLRNKKETLHHRGDYFIQNVIFIISLRKRGVTDRERGDTFLRLMEYVIGFFL